MTVRELLLTTDSYELSEWLVFSNLDHWKDRIAKKAREAAIPGSAVVLSTLFGGKG